MTTARAARWWRDPRWFWLGAVSVICWAFLALMWFAGGDRLRGTIMAIAAAVAAADFIVRLVRRRRS